MVSKPLEVKLQAIEDYLDPNFGGLIAVTKKYKVSHVTVLNWVKKRDEFRRQYEEQQKLAQSS